MCDTLVALPKFTATGTVLFAKNSDREPDEIQELVLLPPRDYPKGQTVKCTYLTIPQARHTHKVLLSRPFWLWGGEMGINEHGLAIGNEALFTKVPHEKKPGLIGMDLLRLALERCVGAGQAVELIGVLLERYGQSGPCGYRDKKFKYHNSFLIADRKDAYVMETFGREWAAKRIDSFYAISNIITLDEDFDMQSRNLGEYARKRKWIKETEPIDLFKVYSSFLFTHFSGAKERRACSLSHLLETGEELDVPAMMRILREHEKGKIPYRPVNGSNRDVCMHAADLFIRKSQTTASMVSSVSADGKILTFVTATAAPCLSVFKPVFLDGPLPWEYPLPTPQEYDPRHLWWRHEKLHRLMLFRYGKFYGEFAAERDQLEDSFVSDALQLADAPVAERTRFVKDCFARAEMFESTWITRLQKEPPEKTGIFYSFYWNRLNKRNNLEGIK